jgi:hypothetical protein
VTEEFAILMKIRICGVRPTGTNVDTPANNKKPPPILSRATPSDLGRCGENIGAAQNEQLLPPPCNCDEAIRPPALNESEWPTTTPTHQQSFDSANNPMARKNNHNA